MSVVGDGGGGRTRTYEGIASGFTVRPLCRSGHSPFPEADALDTQQILPGARADAGVADLCKQDGGHVNSNQDPQSRAPHTVGDYKHGMQNDRRYGRSPQREASSNELLYGLHTVNAALANPRRTLLRLLATRNASQRLAPPACRGAAAPEIVLPQALDRLAGPDAVHQGVIAEFAPLPQPRLDQIPRKGIVVLLDQVTDPHNVGAIMRSCAAFGATALVTTARHSPEGSAVLLKSASGAAEHVPFIKVTNLARAMEELKDYGLTLIGLDAAAEADIGEVPASEPLALVLGAEGKGLRELTRKTCDALARIVLAGPIDSLNVSNAAAIALYALTSRRAG